MTIAAVSLVLFALALLLRGNKARRELRGERERSAIIVRDAYVVLSGVGVELHRGEIAWASLNSTDSGAREALRRLVNEIRSVCGDTAAAEIDTGADPNAAEGIFKAKES